MKRRLLVVVDYQKDFVDGTLGFPGAEKLDAGIAAKIREYGAGNVIYTMDTHRPNYLKTREGIQLPVEHCIVNTLGWEVYGETRVALSEVNAVELRKETFGVSPYDMVSKKLPTANEVESVEFVGLVSNICVASNVVIFQARYPEAQMIVDAALCDSFDKNVQASAYAFLEGIQVKVVNRVA